MWYFWLTSCLESYAFSNFLFSRVNYEKMQFFNTAWPLVCPALSSSHTLTSLLVSAAQAGVLILYNNICREIFQTDTKGGRICILNFTQLANALIQKLNDNFLGCASEIQDSTSSWQMKCCVTKTKLCERYMQKKDLGQKFEFSLLKKPTENFLRGQIQTIDIYLSIYFSPIYISPPNYIGD